MINVRYNVFETNSSSTHCIAVLNPAQMAKLRAQNGYIHIDEDVNSDFRLPSHVKIFTYDEAIEYVKSKFDFLDFEDADAFWPSTYDLYNLSECDFYIITESDSDKLFIVDLTLRD